jgi:hypothetical protein
MSTDLLLIVVGISQLLLGVWLGYHLPRPLLRPQRGLISMDVPPPEGNSGSGPPQDYDG